MTIRRMHVGYWITKATNTLGLCNTCWFSTVIVDARRHLNVSLGQDHIIEASRSHSDAPHSVGLIWTSDRPEAKTST